MLKKRLPKTEIVFISSFPEYAIDAYDCEAFYYLLKPLDENKTAAVMDRFFKKHLSNNRYISFKTKKDTVKISHKEIYFVEYDHKHILYHLQTETYETKGRMCDTFEKLKDFGFCQVHQGYIVNMEKIRKITGLCIILDNGKSVMMSRRRKKEVLKAYAQFLGLKEKP